MKNIKIIGLFLLFATALISCSKWNEFEKYTENGAIIYAGKLDSVKISSGKGRVKLTGILRPDPKIVKCRIFWNGGKDSVEYMLPPITTGLRLFDQTFNVSEGVKSFTVYTYDKDGNKSVSASAIGTSYGDIYRRRLLNRPIGSVIFASNNTTINWEQTDLSTGIQGTETEYVVGNSTLTISTPVSQSTTVLNSFNSQTTKFRYRTIFKPEANCIDTFATAYNTR